MGVKVWDAAGGVVFDNVTRLARILGQVTTGTGADSISDDGFATGDPFYLALPTTWSNIGTPTISFSGTTMSWSAPAAPLLIIYGVF